MPSIHYSSFEAGAGGAGGGRPDAGGLPRPDAERARRRARRHRAGAPRGLVDGARGRPSRARAWCRPSKARSPCSACSRSRARTCTRATSGCATRHTEGLRPVGRYIERWTRSGEVQRFIVDRADRCDVPVIENSNIDATIGAVMDLVLASAERLGAVGSGLDAADDGRAAPASASSTRGRPSAPPSASARFLGAGSQTSAEEAAFSGMRSALDVAADLGSGRHRRRRRAPTQLVAGGEIGAGGEAVDLALDPLEGRGVVARGGQGAMSIVAVAGRDSMPPLPDMYMRQIAVGPRARGASRPPEAGRGQRRRDRRGVRPCRRTT